MDPAPPASTTPSRLDRVLTTTLLLGAIFLAGFLYRNGSPYAGGADSSGYLNSARLLSEGKLFAPVRVPLGHSHVGFGATTFQPLGFFVDSKLPRMAPTYPVGLPLHLVVAARFFGWDRAALIVGIFAAWGGGGLLWLLARHLGFSRAWSAVAVGWLWFCPQFIFSALQPMSDSLALLWCLAVLYTALRAPESGGWCLICGTALAVAVLVRPTNALLIIPVVLALGQRPAAWAWLILGGLPGAALLAYYNHKTYGAVIATGYGDISSVFGPRFVPHNLGHIARWIPGVLSPLICAALTLPFLRGRWTRDGQVLGSAVFVLIGFYAFYFHTGETWWYLRFILPAYPLLILGAITVARAIPVRTPAMQAALIGGCLALSVAWEIKFDRLLHATAAGANERTYRLASDWARENLPANSAVFCMQVSGAFYFYTDFLLVRWEQIEPAALDPLLTVLHNQKRPVYAVLYEFESTDARARLGGHWNQIATVGLATVWQREN